MRRGLRLAARLVGGVVVLSATAVLFLLGLPLRALSPARHAPYRRWAFGWSCRALLRVIGARLEVTGPLPAPPFLLVANHISYLDILSLGAHLPYVFLSKAEVQRWPGIGPLCRAAGTLFIDRAARRDIPLILARLEEVLDRGEGVIFFPEATLTGRRPPPLPFPPPRFPARRAFPVHYGVLHYATPPGEVPAQRSVAWAGSVPFAPHVLNLLRLRSISIRLELGPEPVVETDRKRLAERLYEEISARFVPLAG